jgi:hypothetical protein
MLANTKFLQDISDKAKRFENNDPTLMRDNFWFYSLMDYYWMMDDYHNYVKVFNHPMVQNTLNQYYKNYDKNMDPDPYFYYIKQCLEKTNKQWIQIFSHHLPLLDDHAKSSIIAAISHQYPHQSDIIPQLNYTNITPHDIYPTTFQYFKDCNVSFTLTQLCASRFNLYANADYVQFVIDHCPHFKWTKKQQKESLYINSKYVQHNDYERLCIEIYLYPSNSTDTYSQHLDTCQIIFKNIPLSKKIFNYLNTCYFNKPEYHISKEYIELLKTTFKFK